MTGRELYELVEKGVKPTIIFTECVSDLETQFEKGMLADIVSVKLNETDDVVEIIVDETNYSKFNKNLETPDWYNKETNVYDLKFSEREQRKNIVEIYDGLDVELGNIAFQSDGYTNLQKEYIESDLEISYVDWLQEEVLKLRELGNL